MHPLMTPWDAWFHSLVFSLENPFKTHTSHSNLSSWGTFDSGRDEWKILSLVLFNTTTNAQTVGEVLCKKSWHYNPARTLCVFCIQCLCQEPLEMNHQIWCKGNGHRDWDSIPLCLFHYMRVANRWWNGSFVVELMMTFMYRMKSNLMMMSVLLLCFSFFLFISLWIVS